MAASVFDSQIYSRLFATGEMGKLFTDSAEVRAMMLVEGALAKAQGELGVIPETAGAFLHRALMEVQLDPAALADPAGTNGVTVPGLVAALRKALEAPEYAQYLHWGATSQDIADTGLMLRLRQALNIIEQGLQALLAALADLAETHAETPLAARTYGQYATATSFGAVVAGWGHPLLALLAELPTLRKSVLWVSLSGAAGTGAALGPKAAETRAALAKALGLHDPGRSWHADRGPVLALAAWCSRLSLALGKMGEDVTLMVQSGGAELRLAGAGGSSTMPQKQNPVAPSALVALARQGSGLLSVLHGAAMQQHQRDGASWFTEWMCLPQIVLGAASAATTAKALAAGITPNADAMAAALDSGLDMIHAEALSFALTETLPRPEAQAATKDMCKTAVADNIPLRDLAAAKWPDIDWAALCQPQNNLGEAVTLAKNFTTTAKVLD